MRFDRRFFTGVVLVKLVLMALAFWSYGRLSDRRAAAIGAGNDAVACVRLAAGIEALSRQPTQADSKELQVRDLTRRIEQSASQAGIEMENLIRIWPQPATRISDTPYKKKSTQVLLRQVSLRQVIRFHHALETDSPGLGVTGLRLTAPRRENTNGLWSAESTLTHVVYAAPTLKTNRGDSGK